LNSWISCLPDTEDGQISPLNPAGKAVYDDDFEAFIQIAELCAKLPQVRCPHGVCNEETFLLKDRAKLLDEYIRRTGQGIDVPQKKTEGTEDAPQRPKGKEYWGLNVHGKKRRISPQEETQMLAITAGRRFRLCGVPPNTALWAYWSISTPTALLLPTILFLRKREGSEDSRPDCVEKLDLRTAGLVL